MANILDGKTLAQKLRSEIRAEIEQRGITPGLAVILIGESPASRIYLESKQKDCAAYGIKCEAFTFPEHIAEVKFST